MNLPLSRNRRHHRNRQSNACSVCPIVILTLTTTRFNDNSSTDISSTTLRLQRFSIKIFCLLLYTSAQDSYTSNFCFSKSLFSLISTPTYTMIFFYRSNFHGHYDNTTYIVRKHSFPSGLN